MRRTLCSRNRRRPRSGADLRCEGLETRFLPSAVAWPGTAPPAPERPVDDTLDQAHDLGTLDGGRAEAVGAVGDSPAGAADVDWYQFELAAPAHVRVVLHGRPGDVPLTGALSLYNSDPFDFADAYNPTFHRLLARDDGAAHEGGAAGLDVTLGAGTYHVAVSGSGNHDFHPFLADSGTAGATGGYTLALSAEDAGRPPADGPHVLRTDPEPGAALDRSPFTLRLDLSAPLDPSSVALDDNVRLLYSPTGDFSDGAARQLPLGGFRFAGAVNELQLTPAAPLDRGIYRVLLRGDAAAGQALLGPDGTPLGSDATHGAGADYALTFRVSGAEGSTKGVADDTPAGAHDLGDVSGGGIVRAEGAVGDDPTDPVPFNVADVDLYHFRVTGPGTHAFTAEVFAGRISSPLDASLTLFRAGPDGHLIPLASNADSLNAALDSLGRSLPLYSDPALLRALPAGDYYLAVSGQGNVPDLLSPVPTLPGTNGVFDPEVAHSGTNGFNTGPYVLNVRVTPAGAAPHVVAVTPPDGAALAERPATLEIQFDAHVDLRRLAFEAARGAAASGAVDAVLLQRDDGTVYYPRLSAYDLATDRATLTLFDALPSGKYTLRLSHGGGLRDFAGTPLAGNDPSGEYLSHFTLTAAPRGSPGDPRAWSAGETTADAPLALGLLYPNELVAPGVSIARDASANPDGEDTYLIDVAQQRLYFFRLEGADLPPDAQLTILGPDGSEEGTITVFDQAVSLAPGTQRLRVTGLSPDGGAYRIHVELAGSPQNPVPLVVGNSPLMRLRLVTNTTTTTPSEVVLVPSALSPTRTSAAAPSESGAAAAASPGARLGTPSPVAPATERRTATVSGPAALPSDSLSVRNVSPIQGLAVPGAEVAAPGPERVALRGSPPALGEALVQTVIVTFARGDGGPNEAPDGAAPGGGQSPPAADAGRALDLFFGLWNLFGQMPAPSGQEALIPLDGEGGENSETYSPPLPEDEPDGPAGAWIAAGALCGLLARPGWTASQPERRRRRAGDVTGIPSWPVP